MKVNDFLKKESQMFNRAADYYDIYRPSYPDEIINTLIYEANIIDNSNLLEIGSGSGKATELLVKYNIKISCLDPGPDLVKNGINKFKQYPNVSFHCTRFEDFQITPSFYDVVCAFQSFHWVKQPLGYQLCAQALKDDGFLALVWNMYITYDNDVDNELVKISSKYGQFADFLNQSECEKRINENVKGIMDSGLFHQPKVFECYWNKPYTLDEYYGFCLTGNSFIQKPNHIKEDAYEDLKKLFSKYNGVINRPYLCVLYLSKKLTIS